MTERFFIEDIVELPPYKKYSAVLSRIGDSTKVYSLSEVDKMLVNYFKSGGVK